MFVPIAIAVVVVLAIAWFAVAMVTSRLDATPSMKVFDIEEATTYIGDNLPDRVRNRLSYDDVRLLLRWELTYYRERGVASFGGVDAVANEAIRREQAVVADEDELVDYLLRRVAQEGLDADEVDVVCVSDLASNYLFSIGAVGEAIDLEALPAGDAAVAALDAPVDPVADAAPVDDLDRLADIADSLARRDDDSPDETAPPPSDT